MSFIDFLLINLVGGGGGITLGGLSHWSRFSGSASLILPDVSRYFEQIFIYLKRQ